MCSSWGNGHSVQRYPLGCWTIQCLVYSPPPLSLANVHMLILYVCCTCTHTHTHKAKLSAAWHTLVHSEGGMEGERRWKREGEGVCTERGVGGLWVTSFSHSLSLGVRMKDAAFEDYSYWFTITQQKCFFFFFLISIFIYKIFKLPWNKMHLFEKQNCIYFHSLSFNGFECNRIWWGFHLKQEKTPRR